MNNLGFSLCLSSSTAVSYPQFVVAVHFTLRLSGIQFMDCIEDTGCVHVACIKYPYSV